MERVGIKRLVYTRLEMSAVGGSRDSEGYFARDLFHVPFLAGLQSNRGADV
jgi:hypothetical protein